MYKKNPGYIFNVYLDRRWRFIGIFRRFVTDLIYELFHDDYQAKRIEVGIHELIDNALRYSPEGSDIHIIAKEQKNHIILEVLNFPDEKQKGERYKILRNRIDLLNAEDPLEAYMNCLTTRDESNRLHLGLARIRYECDAKLDVVLEKSSCIKVTAIFPFNPDNLK